MATIKEKDLDKKANQDDVYLQKANEEHISKKKFHKVVFLLGSISVLSVILTLVVLLNNKGNNKDKDKDKDKNKDGKPIIIPGPSGDTFDSEAPSDANDKFSKIWGDIENENLYNKNGATDVKFNEDGSLLDWGIEYKNDLGFKISKDFVEKTIAANINTLFENETNRNKLFGTDKVFADYAAGVVKYKEEKYKDDDNNDTNFVKFSNEIETKDATYTDVRGYIDYRNGIEFSLDGEHFYQVKAERDQEGDKTKSDTVKYVASSFEDSSFVGKKGKLDIYYRFSLHTLTSKFREITAKSTRHLRTSKEGLALNTKEQSYSLLTIGNNFQLKDKPKTNFLEAFSDNLPKLEITGSEKAIPTFKKIQRSILSSVTFNKNKTIFYNAFKVGLGISTYNDGDNGISDNGKNQNLLSDFENLFPNSNDFANSVISLFSLNITESTENTGIYTSEDLKNKYNLPDVPEGEDKVDNITVYVGYKVKIGQYEDEGGKDVLLPLKLTLKLKKGGYGA